MNEFYKKHYQRLSNFVAQRVDDEGVVEELCNTILLAAYESLPNFRHNCNEFSWIAGIGKHKIIDYYRKKKIKTVLFSVSPIFEEVADKALSPERDVLKNELKNEIKKTLADLGKGYGKILKLKYLDGWKVKEIAKKLNIGIKAVESRLSRGKILFRQRWQYDKKKA